LAVVIAVVVADRSLARRVSLHRSGTDDSDAQSLTSLFSNLPSISGISEMAGVGALKSFLPKSPNPVASPLPVEEAGGAWAEADLGGGRTWVQPTR
jgi:hypothetical protein